MAKEQTLSIIKPDAVKKMSSGQLLPVLNNQD